MKTWQQYIPFMHGDEADVAEKATVKKATVKKADVAEKATVNTAGPDRHVVPRRAPASATPRRPRRSDAGLLASVMEQAGASSAETLEPAEVSPAAIVPAHTLDWTLPGFERRALVSTIFGDLPIEALRRRDKVKTISGAYREVQWIDEIRLDADFMERHPEAHPIQIRAKAIDGVMPAQNVLVSPAQEIWSQKIAGASAAHAAVELDGKPNVGRLHRTEITYYRFHVGEPDTVFVSGAWFRVSPPDA